MNIQRWLFDDSGYYAYLLVDCDQQDFNALKKLLVKRGFSVMAAGRSFRPAGDGRQYGFYVRLGKHDGPRLEKPSQNAVVSALKVGGALSEPIPAEVSLGGLTEVIQEVQELRLELRTVAGTVRDTAHRSEERLAAAFEREEAIRLEYARMANLMREVHGQIVESVISALDGRLSNDERVHQLQQLADRQREDAEAWLQFNEELKEDRKRLQDRVAELEVQLEVDRPERPKGGRQDAAEILRACLPTVNLIRGSEDVLFNEFSSPKKALELISRLAHAPENVRSERVEGAKGWLELSFSTGRGRNAGRLYYRRAKDSVDVLVSTKQEQEADIKYLRDHT